MALKLAVEKLDDVDEAARGMYVERDGKFHLDVEGVEDVSGLKSTLQKLRNENKTERERSQRLEQTYEGIDPVKVRDMMAKLENDGESALIAAGRIDEVIAKRTQKLQNDLMKQLDAANGQTKAEQEKAKKYMQRVLDNSIRAAATKAGLHPHAVEDALFRARAMFTVDDEGNAVQLDEDGKPVLGKDGKTPFSPLEWLESTKDTSPHWYPAGNSGGGAGGGKDTSGSGKTMKRSQFDQLNYVEKAEASRNYQIIDG